MATLILWNVRAHKDHIVLQATVAISDLQAHHVVAVVRTFASDVHLVWLWHYARIHVIAFVSTFFLSRCAATLLICVGMSLPLNASLRTRLTPWLAARAG